MREIKIAFVLETDRVPPEQIAERLDIRPFNTRSVFPPKSIAKPWWETELVSDWTDIETALLELRERLKPKLDEIDALVQEYNIAPGVVLTVRCDWADRPVLAVPPYLYPFLERLHAELILDVAYEW